MTDRARGGDIPKSCPAPFDEELDSVPTPVMFESRVAKPKGRESFGVMPLPLPAECGRKVMQMICEGKDGRKL